MQRKKIEYYEQRLQQYCNNVILTLSNSLTDVVNRVLNLFWFVVSHTNPENYIKAT